MFIIRLKLNTCRMNNDVIVFTKSIYFCTITHCKSVNMETNSSCRLFDQNIANSKKKFYKKEIFNERTNKGQQNETEIIDCMAYLKVEHACEKDVNTYVHNDHNFVNVMFNTTARPFKCHFCDKHFTRSSSVSVHERMHTGERSFRCEVCQKQFYRLYNLNIHSRIHTGEKPYVCDICHRSFTQLSNLTAHKRIHTGEKPYKCETCERQFNRLSNLIFHNRMHTGEQPYACDLCGKRFYQSSSMNKHKKLHAGAIGTSCKDAVNCLQAKEDS